MKPEELPEPIGRIRRKWWRLGWLSAQAVARDQLAAPPEAAMMVLARIAEACERIAATQERVVAIQEWMVQEMMKHHPDGPATGVQPPN